MEKVALELHDIAEKIVESFQQGFEQAVNQLNEQLKLHLKNTNMLKANVLSSLMANTPKIATEEIATVDNNKPVLETVVNDVVDNVIETAVENIVESNADQSVK